MATNPTNNVVTLTQFKKDNGGALQGARDAAQRERLQEALIADTALIVGDTPEDFFRSAAAVDNAIREGVVEESVIFNVSPSMSESRSADYANAGLPLPAGVVVFKTLGNPEYKIDAKFVSRTTAEASINFKNVNVLKSWLVPQSNDIKTQRINGRLKNALEFPYEPPILRLNGYGNQFSNIPVVITSLSIDYPDDVDYISTTVGESLDQPASVPIIQKVSVSLLALHALSDLKRSGDQFFKNFNIQDYRNGTLRSY
jgi:hypothetical protein